MEQLLKITTVPIKIEIKTERARLEMKRSDPSKEMQTKPAKLRLQAKNTKVNINTKDMRYSMGYRDVFQMTADAAREGQSAALEATAQYAEIGNQMAKIHKGANIADIMYSKFYRGYATQIAFIPSVGPEIDWVPPSLDIQFDPAQLEIDWNIQRNTFEYHPGKFSIEVVQYPRVDIEYLGDFMYIPPSAKPGYEEENQSE